nr:uncharacterized protein CFP56_26323 [Quercus suber]
MDIENEPDNGDSAEFVVDNVEEGVVEKGKNAVESSTTGSGVSKSRKRGRSPSNAYDSVLTDLSDQLKEIAVALKEINRGPVDYTALYNKVMAMMVDGYSEDMLATAFDHLCENEKLAREFLAKNARLRKLWKRAESDPTVPDAAVRAEKFAQRKRAESDPTVPDAAVRAEKFAQRYFEILEDFKKDPESHGGPPDCILLCRIREQILRELGFRDIFKKVKEEENAKAISLFADVVLLNDAIEDGGKRIENLVRGIFAGNIFDLGSAQLAEIFSKDGMSFLASCQNLVPRPWVIDDLDTFKLKWSKKSWKKAIIFVDNSGADIILGILPFARELLRLGTQVVFAANDLPSINDVTYPELIEIMSKLKDEHGQLMGVDTSNLLLANSGNDLPVIDLSGVSEELAYLASDADLVILEGMGRGIETNLYAQFKCDSLKIGMVKHPEVAQFLGGRLYDCVFKYNEVLS